MRNMSILSASLSTGLTFFACGTRSQEASSVERDRRPVVVQGAMDVEVKQLASRLDGVTVETVGGWTFWRGTLDGYPVIVSKTLKGVSNAAAATTIAAERYRPVAVINQGTAGGHDPQLHVYDIVLGKESLDLGAFKTAYRAPGQGSNSLEWTLMRQILFVTTLHGRLLQLAAVSVLVSVRFAIPCCSLHLNATSHFANWCDFSTLRAAAFSGSDPWTP
jgi:purine-nucleoside phosphorylase